MFDIVMSENVMESIRRMRNGLSISIIVWVIAVIYCF